MQMILHVNSVAVDVSVEKMVCLSVFAPVSFRQMISTSNMCRLFFDFKTTQHYSYNK